MSPSILWFMFMDSMVLFICIAIYVLYSDGSCVKSVHVVLAGLRMRLFVCVHVCISCMYDWTFAFAIFLSVCVHVTMISYTYDLSFTGACGVGCLVCHISLELTY